MEQVDNVDGDASDEERTHSPPKSREERELEKSRTFMLALEELESLRPQLYQAADYCEHQYLFGDNKQGVLDNLKDYSVKALVNAVDHLGTVAYKLNDLIALQHEEIDNTQLAASAVAQSLRACQEHSDREGLKQQSIAKTMHANHKQYTLPDGDYAAKRAGQRNALMLRETFDLSQPAPLTRMHTGLTAEAQLPQPHTPLPDTREPSDLEELSGPRTWYFASDFSSTAKTAPDYLRSTSMGKQQQPLLSPRASFLNRGPNPSFKRATTVQPSRLAVSPTDRFGGPATAAPAKPVATRSGSVTPMRTPPALTPASAPVKTGNLNLEKTMFLTPAVPPVEAKHSKGKGILRSLLGRRS